VPVHGTPPLTTMEIEIKTEAQIQQALKDMRWRDPQAAQLEMFDTHNTLDIPKPATDTTPRSQRKASFTSSPWK